MKLDVELQGSDSPAEDVDTVASSLEGLALLIGEARGRDGLDGFGLCLMLHASVLRGIAAALFRAQGVEAPSAG